MSLFLSRILLNPYSKDALQLASDPYRVHLRLVELFVEEPKTNRVLFRIDPSDQGPLILVQSTFEPNWSHLQIAERDLRQIPQCKPLNLNLQARDRLTFRLRARPTKRNNGGMKDRVDLRTDDERLQWLQRKSATCGFKLASCEITPIAVDKMKYVGPKDKQTFAACQFDGLIQVLEPELLQNAVKQGIGTQKSMGFGLLSLARG